MPSAEVFSRPTVKQVIFQMTYPNLFFIENKIGDFQQTIIDRFPESSLIYRQQLVLADIGPEAKLEEIPTAGPTRKIWQFRSPDQVILNVLSDSLDISSSSHKTYDHPDSGHRFRDAIEFAVGKFLSIVKIPTLRRVGLRYIDECPIPEQTSDAFRKWYKSVFPLDRFPLENATEMDFKAVVQKDDYYLRYIESLKIKNGKAMLVLDFDGYAEKVRSEDYLARTDNLHDLIAAEYFRTIREPVKQFMRGEIEVPSYG